MKKKLPNFSPMELDNGETVYFSLHPQFILVTFQNSLGLRHEKYIGYSLSEVRKLVRKGK